MDSSIALLRGVPIGNIIYCLRRLMVFMESIRSTTLILQYQGRRRSLSLYDLGALFGLLTIFFLSCTASTFNSLSTRRVATSL